MKKRYTVLGLSVVLALALAVPALGGPSNPIASASAGVKSIANKALKKAKAAQTAATNAQNTANAASSAAASAQKDATAADKEAAGAQKTATSAQGTATTALSTANAAKKEAGEAKTAAATAQTAANSAQTAADNAQATANGKMSGEVQVEGEEGTTFGIAGCPTGKVPTGGGFIITGTQSNAATVTESSQYGTAWIVFAEQIEGTTGSDWGTVATVNCATSP